MGHVGSCKGRTRRKPYSSQHSGVTRGATPSAHSLTVFLVLLVLVASVGRCREGAVAAAVGH